MNFSHKDIPETPGFVITIQKHPAGVQPVLVTLKAIHFQGDTPINANTDAIRQAMKALMGLGLNQAIASNLMMQAIKDCVARGELAPAPTKTPAKFPQPPADVAAN